MVQERTYLLSTGHTESRAACGNKKRSWQVMGKEKWKRNGKIWANSLAVMHHEDAPSHLENKGEANSTSPVPWLENGWLCISSDHHSDVVVLIFLPTSLIQDILGRM